MVTKAPSTNIPLRLYLYLYPFARFSKRMTAMVNRSKPRKKKRNVCVCVYDLFTGLRAEPVHHVIRCPIRGQFRQMESNIDTRHPYSHMVTEFPRRRWRTQPHWHGCSEKRFFKKVLILLLHNCPRNIHIAAGFVCTCLRRYCIFFRKIQTVMEHALQSNAEFALCVFRYGLYYTSAAECTVAPDWKGTGNDLS